MSGIIQILIILSIGYSVYLSFKKTQQTQNKKTMPSSKNKNINSETISEAIKKLEDRIPDLSGFSEAFKKFEEEKNRQGEKAIAVNQNGNTATSKAKKKKRKQALETPEVLAEEFSQEGKSSYEFGIKDVKNTCLQAGEHQALHFENEVVDSAMDSKKLVNAIIMSELLSKPVSLRD